MRRVVPICLAFLFTTGPALAASPEPHEGKSAPSRFYIFDGSSFEGSTRGPSMELMNPRRDARFARLLSLKKDLLGNIGATLKDRALK
jgi:hypothetical protein